MFTWLMNNASTIVVFAILIGIVVLILASMRKNKKQGKSSCGCGCADCALKDSCHKK